MLFGRLRYCGGVFWQIKILWWCFLVDLDIVVVLVNWLWWVSLPSARSTYLVAFVPRHSEKLSETAFSLKTHQFCPLDTRPGLLSNQLQPIAQQLQLAFYSKGAVLYQQHKPTIVKEQIKQQIKKRVTYQHAAVIQIKTNTVFWNSAFCGSDKMQE